ncbi:hypothetical protein [Archangium lipolyticum]|uniref:hypothetical protein n=1 Tax=Archangium lipolyticum TaxID=2970465 RepID=UPI00214B2A4D|nr:hypothetical protein [Archangium lipolyticum]
MKMRKFLTVFSLGSCLLMTGAGAQTPPAAQPDKAPKVEQNACYLWKGRGGSPQGSYMATHANCRPWNSHYGWSFFKHNNGADYYRGTFKDAVVTPSTWAVYADFGSAVVSSKADYDSFVANTKLSGSCGECLH